MPLPTLIAVVLTALAWVSVLVYHDAARWAGGAWMLFGLVGYVIYRKGFEGTPLTQHVEVPEEALVKDVPAVEYAQIMVPVFGTKLDDDIVGTAGRLADAADREGELPPTLVLVFVVEMPLTVPLDARPPKEAMALADHAFERASAVAEEYETVEVTTVVGAGAVDRLGDRRDGAGAEAGGDRDGRRAADEGQGRGGARRDRRPRPDEIGPVTEYVLKRAPCRVLITAPPGEVVAGGERRDGRAKVDCRRMFVLIVGAGRVGSTLARSMLSDGHQVSCLDEDPESHARLEIGLERTWEDMGGQFTVGAGLEIEALTAAGIERADVFVASTDGDNTNVIISQIAKRRFNVPTVIARVLDPLRAQWYERQGLHTICPTRVAIEMLENEVRLAAKRAEGVVPPAGGVDAEDADF